MVTNSSAGPDDAFTLFPDGLTFRLQGKGTEGIFVRRYLISDENFDKTITPSENRLAYQLGVEKFIKMGLIEYPEDSAERLKNAVIYICGHAARDKRCGIMGPLLRDEFEKQLDRLWASETQIPRPNVELISHIGGHVFAGNVIIYMPNSDGYPEAHRGIWYGRVEPKHVEGILQETIIKGNIIEELFRGGTNYYGDRISL